MVAILGMGAGEPEAAMYRGRIECGREIAWNLNRKGCDWTFIGTVEAFCPAGELMSLCLAGTRRAYQWQEVGLNRSATERDRYLVSVWWKIRKNTAEDWGIEEFRRRPIFMGPDAHRLERAVEQPAIQAMVWLFNQYWLSKNAGDFMLDPAGK